MTLSLSLMLLICANITRVHHGSATPFVMTDKIMTNISFYTPGHCDCLASRVGSALAYSLLLRERCLLRHP